MLNKPFQVMLSQRTYDRMKRHKVCWSDLVRSAIESELRKLEDDPAEDDVYVVLEQLNRKTVEMRRQIIDLCAVIQKGARS